MIPADVVDSAVHSTYSRQPGTNPLHPEYRHEGLSFLAASNCFAGFFVSGATAFGLSFVPELLTFC